METRKVYKSGGSTFVISLPKKWVNQVGIKEGDSVVVREVEGSLTISVGELKKGPNKAVIDSEKLESRADLKLLIISHYLAGYDEIVVKFKGKRRLENKKEIREVIGFLIGLEVAEEHEDNVLLEVMLDQERISTPLALKRMHLIIKSMLKDVQEVIENKDTALANDILIRENEVDRLYFFIVRQLKSAVRYHDRAQRLGMNQQREVLGYRIVVKSFERISDHVEKLVINYLEIVDSPVNLDRVMEMMGGVLKLFEVSSKSVFKKDQRLASEVFQNFNAFKKRYIDDVNTVFTEKHSLPSAIYYKGMLDSLLRIADYSSDISEIALNMSVTVP